MTAKARKQAPAKRPARKSSPRKQAAQSTNQTQQQGGSGASSHGGAWGVGLRPWDGTKPQQSEQPTKSAQLIADRELARIGKKK
jgi:hypothetical protein